MRDDLEQTLGSAERKQPRPLRDGRLAELRVHELRANTLKEMKTRVGAQFECPAEVMPEL